MRLLLLLKIRKLLLGGIAIISSFYKPYLIADQNTFKIAVVGPLTGTYSFYGKQLLSAVNQAITDLSTSKNQLEIVPFDDQCNVDLAKSIAITIIKNPEIKAVIGHVCSETTLVASKIYSKGKILQLIPSSTNLKITESNINTLFKMCGKDDIQAQTIARFISNKFGNKKIAIIHNKDLYSKDLAALVQEYLAILKIAPSLYQTINIQDLANNKKIKTILRKIQKLNIDVIFFAGLYKETADFIKAMHYQKNNIPIIISDSNATTGFIKSLGCNKMASGTIMSFQKLDELNKNSNLIQSSIIGHELFGYAAVEVINAAINNVNYITTQSLASWIHNNKIQTIMGEKSWDTNGDILNSEFSIYIWDDKGRYWPLNFN